MGGNNVRRCFDCAYCSYEYPSLRDVCDKTGIEIRDVYTHCCDEYVEAEDEEKGENECWF